VAVGVHREADLAVAQDLHHHPGRDALGQKKGGAAVTQVASYLAQEESVGGRPARER
jgi:hypothetical protein